MPDDICPACCGSGSTNDGTHTACPRCGGWGVVEPPAVVALADHRSLRKGLAERLVYPWLIPLVYRIAGWRRG